MKMQIKQKIRMKEDKLMQKYDKVNLKNLVDEIKVYEKLAEKLDLL
jgi:hypothetical protein